jgi:glucose-1-phosphate thymidylyltransferase
MFGIILAGGSGSRLAPLTKTTNKHLLPIAKKPMILHNIEKLRDAGIKDIVIVTGTEHMGDFVDLLGSGSEYNVDLTYKVQDSANGIAGALSLAEKIVHRGPFIAILGDNIFEDSLKPIVHRFEQDWENGKYDAKVLLKNVHDPERFGVPTIVDNKITEINEKPKEPKSNYAVVGIYMLDTTAFDYIKQIEPSARGELEITDVLNFYIDNGNLGYDFLTLAWQDAGTFDSYRKANDLAWSWEGK